MAAHLASCAGCRAEAAELGEVWSGLGTSRWLCRRGRAEAFSRGAAGVPGRAAAGRPIPSPRAHRVGRFAGMAGALAASLLVAGALGGRYLTPAPTAVREGGDLAQLREQVGDLRPLVTLALLQEQSPSARLRGVTYTTRCSNPTARCGSAAVRRESRFECQRAALGRGCAREIRRRSGRAPGARGCHSGAGFAARAGGPDRPAGGLARCGAVPALRALAHDSQANEAARERAVWGLGNWRVEVRRNIALAIMLFPRWAWTIPSEDWKVEDREPYEVVQRVARIEAGDRQRKRLHSRDRRRWVAG